MITIILNKKELNRQENGYTAISRPNKENGGWNVAVVNVETGKPVFKLHYVKFKEDIGKAIASDLRMMDKCGFAHQMADKSRHR